MILALSPGAGRPTVPSLQSLADLDGDRLAGMLAETTGDNYVVP